MTDTTGDIYYSGQICRVSAALGTGCGKCEKCKAEAEVKKEQLYICDHVTKGCNCTWAALHSADMKRNKECSSKGIITKSIPYTEEKEPEKSCETCGQSESNGGLCVVDFNCKENYYQYYTPIKKEEKEPKTKRVAVLWFGDVPEEGYENPMLIDEMTGKVIDQVELIDPERLRYGTPEAGEEVILPSKGIVKADPFWKDPIGLGTGKEKCLIIDPPTPEPETVDDLIFELSEFDSIGYDEIQDLVERLKSAQERSKS
jgi:hypothetical protein